MESKVQSYMASGKPIVGCINGSCCSFIENNGIGFCCQSGDSEALANLIRNLKIEEIKTIGKHSRELYFEKYNKNRFIDTLILFKLKKLINIRVLTKLNLQ